MYRIRFITRETKTSRIGDLSPKNWSRLKVSIWADKIEKRRKGLCQENATHRNKLSTL